MSRSGSATKIVAVLVAIGASACGKPPAKEPSIRTAYVEVAGMVQQLGIT